MVQLTEAVIRAKTRVHDLGDVKNLNLWGQGITGLMLKAILKLGYRQHQKSKSKHVVIPIAHAAICETALHAQCLTSAYHA